MKEKIFGLLLASSASLLAPLAAAQPGADTLVLSPAAATAASVHHGAGARTAAGVERCVGYDPHSDFVPAHCFALACEAASGSGAASPGAHPTPSGASWCGAPPAIEALEASLLAQVRATQRDLDELAWLSEAAQRLLPEPGRVLNGILPPVLALADGDGRDDAALVVARIYGALGNDAEADFWLQRSRLTVLRQTAFGLVITDD